MDMAKFVRGARLSVLGTPRVEVGRALLALAVIGGTMVPTLANAFPVAADVTLRQASGPEARLRVSTPAQRVVRGPSMAAPRVVKVAATDDSVFDLSGLRDSGADMARKLGQSLGIDAPPPAQVPAYQGREAYEPPAAAAPPARMPVADEAPPPARMPVADGAPRQDPAYAPADRLRVPATVVPEFNEWDLHPEPDAEIAADGVTTVTGTAMVPSLRTPVNRFNPPNDGRRRGIAPNSRFGVEYTWTPVLHSSKQPDGNVSVIEGGFTDRSSVRPGSFAPQVMDPSDAFMVVAVKTSMENTGATYEATVASVEDLLVKAKTCVLHFGMNHACSASADGVTFDYGTKTFTAALTKDDPAVSKGPGFPSGRFVVAVETVQGLFEGAAYDRVIQPYQPGHAP